MSAAVVARPRRRRDAASVALRVWAIAVYAFLFLPILVIVVYSFNNGRTMLTWGGLGLNGYRTGTVDPTILDAVKTSIVAATGTAIIATILGSFAGIALARRKGKWTVLFLALVFLILVTPEIVDAIALLIWYVRLGGPFGPTMKIPAVSYGMLRLVDRALAVRDRRGHVDRARTTRRYGGDARGSRCRSVRDTLEAVQPDHAPAHAAGRARRSAACRSASAWTTRSSRRS